MIIATIHEAPQLHIMAVPPIWQRAEQLRMCAYIGWGTEEAMVMAPCLNFHVMFSRIILS